VAHHIDRHLDAMARSKFCGRFIFRILWGCCIPPSLATGFKVNSGEYKLMGLAPYGQPAFANRILDNLIDVKPDGSFRLNMDYFAYCTALTMTNRRFDALFGGPPRAEDEILTQRHMDLAASIQEVLEDVVLKMTRALAAETGERISVWRAASRSTAWPTERSCAMGDFGNIWIQPAAGDAGGALGAALTAYHLHAGQPRIPAATGESRDAMHGALLGPAFSDDEIERRLESQGARFTRLSDTALIDATAAELAEGHAVGWFQGRMEFGPRALGTRSILGDARSPSMQRNLNLKVKFRESFRPFAPAVTREAVSDWFDLDVRQPPA
jgi:carbamoyltransferase